MQAHVNQVQSVLTALESLIDASSDVNVGAIASNGVLPANSR